MLSLVWRNFGLFWAYVVFNVFAAAFLYWAFRVKHFSLGSIGTSIKGLIPKKPKPQADTKEGQNEMSTAQPY